jgi:hypothetical protein
LNFSGDEAVKEVNFQILWATSNALDQGSPNYGPRCDFIWPAKEQIIITASVVLITIFALKATFFFALTVPRIGSEER